nr:hypothetical protein [Tanacetum cinerariifolium]
MLFRTLFFLDDLPSGPLDMSCVFLFLKELHFKASLSFSLTTLELGRSTLCCSGMSSEMGSFSPNGLVVCWCISCLVSLSPPSFGLILFMSLSSQVESCIIDTDKGFVLPNPPSEPSYAFDDSEGRGFLRLPTWEDSDINKINPNEGGDKDTKHEMHQHTTNPLGLNEPISELIPEQLSVERPNSKVVRENERDALKCDDLEDTISDICPLSKMGSNREDNVERNREDDDGEEPNGSVNARRLPLALLVYTLVRPSMTTLSANNSVFRGFFKKQKLTGPNFINWYRQLRIIISIEDKLNYLEQPIPPALVALAGQHVAPEILVAHNAWIKGSKEIAGLMLMTMELEIQQNMEPLHAHEMLRELKTLFAQQAEQELLQTMRDFHSCKQEEGQSVSLYVLKMKGYIDNLERLGNPMTLGLGVSLILIGLRKECDGFVKNYNMHNMGKTVNEWHAMLKLHEQTLPKSNAPALNVIRAGKVQKGNKHKKSQSQIAAKGQNHGKGENKQAYAPKPKITPPPKRENPQRTQSVMSVCLRASRKLKPGDLSLYVGNGQREVVETIGAFYLCLPSGLEIVLNNCHYSPSITRGVISVSRLYEDDFINRFVDNTIQVYRNNMVYFSAIPRDDLDFALLWHCRLGHISKKRIEKLQHDGLLDSSDLRAFEKCISCMSRKMARKPYTHQVEKAKDLLGLIHTDVCGPFKIISRHGASYFVTFTDDFSQNSLINQEASGSLEDLEIIQEEDTHPSIDTSLNHEEDDLEIDEPQRDLGEPANYKAALLDLEFEKWLNAMNVEMQSMKDNEVILKPPGIDYEETFSPIADIRAIRILIAIAAYHDYEIWQIDVKTAYLNGFLNKEVYMEQPEGFVNPKYPNRICKLKRSIYGLKQASRKWNKRFDDEIKKFGFTQNRDEPCVYLKASRSNITFLIFHVDDILIMGNSIPMLQSVKTYLEKCFAMKDLGEAAYILGIKIYIDRSKRLIGLCQSAYIKKILKRYCMENSKRGSIPMQEKLKLSKSQGASTPAELKRMQNVPYASANPGDIHWTTFKNIMKYLMNTKDMFLVYEGDLKRELRISCYIDAGYLTDVDDLKSQTEFVFVLNGGAVDWKSAKQSIFATSFAEAEYIAAFDAFKEDVWVKKFIFGLGVVPTIEEPISMYCDNTGAISIANDSGITKGARHFRAKVHYLREGIKFCDIKLEKVHTYDNLADPFTKALAFPKHSEHTRNIEILPASS